MRLIGWPKVHGVQSWEELRRFTSNFQELLPPILNGGIEFGYNIRSTFPTEFSITIGATIALGASGAIGATLLSTISTSVTSVPHNLGTVPTGYLICYQTTPAVIYAANPSIFPWTPTQIFLTASEAVTAKAIIF